MPRIIVGLTSLFAVLFLLSAWGIRPAFGEEARACSEDIESFCRDVKPGGGRIISCLKTHESELSSLCREKLQELQRRVDEAKRACTTDIEKFCKGVEPGEGRIARCLEGHGEELSPACAEKMGLLKATLKAK